MKYDDDDEATTSVLLNKHMEQTNKPYDKKLQKLINNDWKKITFQRKWKKNTANKSEENRQQQKNKN